MYHSAVMYCLLSNSVSKQTNYLDSPVERTKVNEMYINCIRYVMRKTRNIICQPEKSL